MGERNSLRVVSPLEKFLVLLEDRVTILEDFLLEVLVVLRLGVEIFDT